MSDEIVAQRTKPCENCGAEHPIKHYPRNRTGRVWCGACLLKEDDEKTKASLAKHKAERERVAKGRKVRKIRKYTREGMRRLRGEGKKRHAAGLREVERVESAPERARVAAEKLQVKRKLIAEKKYETAVEEAELSRKVLVERELASRFLAKQHLMPFIMRNHPGYLAGWVHKDMAARLERFSQDVADEKSPRLMLQMPPRTGKSQEASVYFPAWHLGRYPRHEFIMSTYSGSLALTFSRKVRSILRDDAYRLVFPGLGLDRDNQNAEGWLTNKGGGFVPAGVGGAITGKGAHILLVDDPVKNAEEAESQTVRQAIKDWYASTAYTRLAPGGGVLIIQTRWHEDDLSGWLERQMLEGTGDEFEIVRYPAIAEADEHYRYKGEALHPERYDEKALARIERAVGPRVWSALYQQAPTSEDGGYFTKDMFQLYESHELPKDLVYYTAWDFAISKQDRADYTVGITVGVDEHDDIWLVSMYRKRMDAFEIVETILDTWERWDDRLVGMEKGHILLALQPHLEKRITERKSFGFPILELAPGRRDKELRGRAIQGRARQGRVHVPKDASWTDLFFKEVLAFPFGVNDDIPDTLGWIGVMLAELETPAGDPVVRKPSWKDKLNQYSTSLRRKTMMSS